MKIPRIAHWIWFGPNAPEWAEANIETFCLLHPDWMVRVWHELPTDFPSEFRAIVDSLPWYSSRSDIFRYWLLAQYGGVYLDTDIVTLRPFESLLNYSFFLAPSLPEGHTQPHLNCALMGCERGSHAMSRVLEECLRRSREESPPKRISYGPDLLTRLFKSGDADVTIFPLHYFYAIPDRATAHRFWKESSVERNEILAPFRRNFSDDQEPFAVHLWGVNGSSQRKTTDL